MLLIWSGLGAAFRKKKEDAVCRLGEQCEVVRRWKVKQVYLAELDMNDAERISMKPLW